MQNQTGSEQIGFDRHKWNTSRSGPISAALCFSVVQVYNPQKPARNFPTLSPQVSIVLFPFSPRYGSDRNKPGELAFWSLFASSLVLILLGGCSNEEQIRRYKAPRMEERGDAAGKAAVRSAPEMPGPAMPKPAMPASPPQSVEGPRRTLGAIIPRESDAWFFRVTGHDERVADQRDAWLQFVQSLQFDGDQPQWQLPEGWQQEPGSGMRFATIVMDPEDPPLELSVIPLPMPRDGDVDAYVLANVNRWRGQLALPPMDAGQLAREAETVGLPDTEITLVDFGESP